jgi:hypothetical protein
MSRKLPSIREYPKEIQFGDVTYTIKFCRDLGHPDTMGECDPGDRVIRIKLGQGRKDTLKTFIHEVLHVLEMEHPVALEHKTIYKLEEAVFNFLWSNYFKD